MKKYLMLLVYFFLTQVCAGKPPLLFTPLTSTTVQNYGSGSTTVNYKITNQLTHTYKFAMVPITGVTQDTSSGFCDSIFTLASNAYCILSLSINRGQLIHFNDSPKICVEKNGAAGSFMCSQPSAKDVLKVTTIDPNFPYGTTPQGNVCQSQDEYATPETMLGSWAMVDAVAQDEKGNVLPSFLNSSNVVYAVGTAAIGNALGLSGCGTGCNQLNGYCFALKFNGKSPYPYMIFQSVNIGANTNSFDIYMAGGGSGAFPLPCPTFWGTGGSVTWSNHIEDSSCQSYFGDYSSITSNYSVTYGGVTHTAKETLQNACTFASAGQSGFNTQNWSNVSVVAVSCPQSLVQITGLQIPSTITTIGNQNIINLSSLTDNNFSTTTITGITTTQMQDCKTPSSGYCNNVPVSVPNYQASISASLTAPLLTGAAPSSTYCEQYPNTSFCSWNNGVTSGSDYCNANQPQCFSCGGGPTWCTCKGTTLSGCIAGILGLNTN